VDVVTFCGLSLAALPGLVMTPRPASEGLVSAAVARIGDTPARVADVGTGSGAIAVSIALGSPKSHVWATDVSAAATVLARANARRLGVADRVHVVGGDLLDPAPERLDLVVANLPYLPLRDRPRHQELAGEPEEAVFAPGDGLELCRRLLRTAETKLVPDGAVVLQLRRRVVVAERDELAGLADALPSLAPAPERAGLAGAARLPLPV
jgi:release factor glutamine methyltransferase